MNTSIVVHISIAELQQLIETAVSNAMTTKAHENSNKLLNSDEAAEFLNIPKNTLYLKTSKRELKYMKLGRRNMFEKEDLMAWARERKLKTANEIINESR